MPYHLLILSAFWRNKIVFVCYMSRYPPSTIFTPDNHLPVFNIHSAIFTTILLQQFQRRFHDFFQKFVACTGRGEIHYFRLKIFYDFLPVIHPIAPPSRTGCSTGYLCPFSSPACIRTSGNGIFLPTPELSAERCLSGTLPFLPA